MSQNIKIEQLEKENIKGYIKDSIQLFFRNPILSFIPILLSFLILNTYNISFNVFFIYFCIISPIIIFSFIYSNDNSSSLLKIKPYFAKFTCLENIIIFLGIILINFLVMLFMYAYGVQPEEKEVAKSVNEYVIYLYSSFIFSFVFTKYVIVNMFSLFSFLWLLLNTILIINFYQVNIYFLKKKYQNK